MSAKIQIPDALKADVPHTTFGKILAATPIVMTVIATLLAGLSSGEMTRAQYDRAYAAQLQAKAGDQWNYFQAKRLRAAMQRSTLDVLRGTTTVHALDSQALAARFNDTPVHAALETPGGQQALETLAHGTIPSASADSINDPRILAVLAAIDAGQTDAELAILLAPIPPEDLSKALRAANERVRAFDATLKPINQAIDAMEKGFARPAASSSSGAPTDQLARDFVVARLNYTAQRYDVESRQNQAIAQIYELQVRKSNLSAERHHARSQRFFYGMLAAQMGVIISTFSMAARKQNFLWALAATAGTAAVAFAAYVYLFV